MNTGTLTILFLILIKVLFVAFVLGLVVGGIVFVKDNLFTEEEKAKFRGMFTNNKVVAQKKACDCCGKELKAEWKACPHCGKTVENKIVIETECQNA